jgi:hypothetical protein
MDLNFIRPTQRTWLAILTLFFLSPFIAEVITGSTPPLQLLSLFPWLTLPTFYGPGALLAREIVRRRGWGWENLFVLGMAYGILEEGIQNQSWFNFTSHSPNAGYQHYGEFFQTNWLWALNLTMYHTVMSIILPIIIVELLFPQIAKQPWVGTKGRFGLGVLLGVVTIGVGFLTAFKFYAREGYTHPPVIPYLIAIVLMLSLFLVGSRIPLHLPSIVSSRTVPRLWTVRMMMWAITVGNFLLVFIGKGFHIPFVFTLLLTLAYDGVALRWVYVLSARPGWNASYRLAVASGIIAFYMIFALLLEFAVGYPGVFLTLVVEGVFGALLSVFAGILRRRVLAEHFTMARNM